ncbi:MAG: tyrosine-type recombinase/integrase, partial [Verrucomicrobiota bacterium]
MTEDVMVERALAYFAIEKGHATNTQLNESVILDRFASWFFKNQSSWASLKIEQVLTYLKKQRRNRNLSAGSMKLEIIVLRNFLRFLHREKVLELDLADQLEIPKLPSRLPKTLTEEEVDRLIQVEWEDSPLGLRNHAIIEVLYASGIRVSELCDLRMEKVDL